MGRQVHRGVIAFGTRVGVHDPVALVPFCGVHSVSEPAVALVYYMIDKKPPVGTASVVVKILFLVPYGLSCPAAFQQEVVTLCLRLDEVAFAFGDRRQCVVAGSLQHLRLRPSHHPSFEYAQSWRGAAFVVVGSIGHLREIARDLAFGIVVADGVVEVRPPKNVSELVAERAYRGENVHPCRGGFKLGAAGIALDGDTVEGQSAQRASVRPDPFGIAVALCSSRIVDENVARPAVLGELAEIHVVVG